MNRRGFMGSILALGVAPAIVRADSLMRIVPRETIILGPGTILRADLFRDGVCIEEIVGPIDFACSQWAIKTRWISGDEFRRLYPGVRMTQAMALNRLPLVVCR